MTNNYTEEFRKDLKKFNEMTEKFYNKEITVPEYKGFSGGFGSYAQRGGERSMIRLRLSGGEINEKNINAQKVFSFFINIMTNFASDFKDKMKSKENASAALLSLSSDDVALCCRALF